MVCISIQKGAQTELIDIVFALAKLLEDWIRMELVLAHAAPGFGHQDKFMAGKAILFNGLGNDTLRVAVGVNVGRVPLFTRSEEHKHEQ